MRVRIRALPLERHLKRHAYHSGWLAPLTFLSVLLSLSLVPFSLAAQSPLARIREEPKSLAELARRLRTQRAQKDLSSIPFFTNDNLSAASSAISPVRESPRLSEIAESRNPIQEQGNQGTAAKAKREEARERALAHVKAQEFEQALEIFRRLAAENPRDYEARVWVARLESWLDRYTVAEELYREVLREDPGNLEAELGLVDVLSWQGRYGEAQERLHGLWVEHPHNIEVLLRLAKLARWQRRRREALQYYGRVLAVDPTNTEAQTAVEALRAETNYQLEFGYFLEEFDFARNTNGNFVELLYHDNDRTWLLGRFQYQNKFRENNTRFTLGATYRFFHRTWVRGEVSLAPTGQVIANQDYTLEVTQGLHPRFSIGTAYRFLNFRSADVHVLTALVNWDLRPNLHLYVRYNPSRTSFDFTGRSVWNQNGWARLVWDANATWSPWVAFAVGSENFTGISAEQLGRFAAQTYSVGSEVRITPRQGFRVGYYFQNRTRGSREQGAGLSYFYRF